MNKVSAVLVSWKRPEELGKVVAHLHTIPFIDEILIWRNLPDSNLQVYARFLMAQRAKNDTIYTQDDDCIIENIEEIYSHYDGKHITNGLKKEAIESYSKRPETLLGWGSFWPKSYAWIHKPYIDEFGVDYHLHTNADRIFTMYVGKPFITIEAKVKDFPCATNTDAMAVQPSFMMDRAAALAKAEMVMARSNELPIL